MTLLLRLATTIDAINERIARGAAWLVVAAVVISAGNAISRKAFSLSSNAWLELQWYLFGAVFLLGAAWTLKRDEHVRIDVVSSRLSRRVRDRIDVIGHLAFLIPFAALHVFVSVPFFLRSWRSGEVSASAGGLVLWPAKLLVLIGFSLLLAQALSETIKRVALMRGARPEEIGSPPPGSGASP